MKVATIIVLSIALFYVFYIGSKEAFKNKKNNN